MRENKIILNAVTEGICLIFTKENVDWLEMKSFSGTW